MRLGALYIALAVILSVDVLAFLGLAFFGGSESFEHLAATTLPVAFTVVALHVAAFVGMSYFLYIEVVGILQRAKGGEPPRAEQRVVVKRPQARAYDGLYNPS